MNKKNTISVIVPVYNTEKYIGECLDSLINQTIPFYEIVLIDDGSNDSSLAICQNYSSKYNNVSVYHQENKRQGAARNQGLMHITSEYVMFVDSDDFLMLDALEKLTRVIQKQQYDLLFYSGKTIFEDDKLDGLRSERDFSGIKNDVMTGGEYFNQIYPDRYKVSVCFNVFRVSFLKERQIFFPEEVLFEDNYVSIVSILEAQKVGYLAEQLYNRRIRNGSTMTTDWTEQKIVDLSQVFIKIFDYIKKNHNLFVGMQSIKQYVVDSCYNILELFKKISASDSSITHKTKEIIAQFIGCYEELRILLVDFVEEQEIGIIIREWQILSLINEMDCSKKRRNVDSLVCSMKEKYITLLSSLPLQNTERKVGIYGIGKHTQGILSLYGKYIGEIRAKLYFVETKRTKDEYYGYKVLNVEDIPSNSIDVIIISSFIYRHQMKERVGSLDATVNIIDLYSNTYQDIFSQQDIVDLLLYNN